MNDLIDLLKNVPLFQDLSKEELESICPLLQEIRWKRGNVIFLEGDTGDELFIIKKGIVKIYRYNDKKEIILAIFGPGDFFGEMAIIQPSLNRSAAAETLENCLIYSLKRAVFYDFMMKHPHICIKLLEVTAQRLRRANDQIYNLTFLDVRTRILRSIIYLANQHGVNRNGGVWIDIRITHQQLADMAGTSRESATKVLQTLSEEGLIVVKKKRIFLNDYELLKGLAGLND